MSDLVPYEGKKKKTKGSGTKLCEKLETDDMTAILDMVIDTSIKRMGRPAEYPFTAAGLEAFTQSTIDYFEYVNSVNMNPDLERKLIPDVENWAMYLGITRRTLLTYERRGGEWQSRIEYFKNAIGAVKKQLAMTYKIPPMVYVFDATNNHGYVNSNEFKLTQGKTEENSGRANLEEQLKAAGVIWNDEKGEFEPREV